MLTTVKRLGFYLTVSILFMSVMIIGFTVFYHFSEGYSWLDSFYFTVITTRTIGFGDLTPHTDVGKLGTVVNALLPATVFMGTSLLILDAAFKALEEHWKQTLMDKHNNHTIVIGDLDFIPSIIQELNQQEQDYIIVHDLPIGSLPHHIGAIVNESTYLHGDPSSDLVLKKAKIETAAQILIASSDDAHNLFALVSAKSLNPDINASVLVNKEETEAKFRSVGADHILPSAPALGRMLSLAANNPIAHDFIVKLQTHTNDPFITEVTTSSEHVGKKINDIFKHAVAVFRDNNYIYDLRQEIVQVNDVVLCLKLKYEGESN